MNLHDRQQMLSNFMLALGRMSKECLEDVLHLFTPYDARRKQIITAAGDTERYLYFVCEGIQRIYFTKNNGQEATLVFTYAPSFGGVIDSLLIQRPSAYAYETLSESAFLRIHFLQWQQLRTKHEMLVQLESRLNVEVISGLLHRMAQLQCFTAEEKFRALLQRSPHILNLVPHKYLANYLGIDAATFSRLLASVRI